MTFLVLEVIQVEQGWEQHFPGSDHIWYLSLLRNCIGRERLERIYSELNSASPLTPPNSCPPGTLECDLIGNRVLANVMKMKSFWIRVGFIFNNRCPKKKKRGHTG